jgi:hypothetical protein
MHYITGRFWVRNAKLIRLVSFETIRKKHPNNFQELLRQISQARRITVASKLSELTMKTQINQT